MKISECETILNEVKFVKSHEEIIEKNGELVADRDWSKKNLGWSR